MQHLSLANGHATLYLGVINNTEVISRRSITSHYSLQFTEKRLVNVSEHFFLL